MSLFRPADRALIAGDAITTVKEESVIAVALQIKEVHRPPAYFTTDWEEVRKSVQRLEALHPSVVISGHGKPMAGEELRAGLAELARHFDTIAIPEHGRYVH